MNGQRQFSVGLALIIVSGLCDQGFLHNQAQAMDSDKKFDFADIADVVFIVPDRLSLEDMQLDGPRDTYSLGELGSIIAVSGRIVNREKFQGEVEYLHVTLFDCPSDQFIEKQCLSLGEGKVRLASYTKPYLRIEPNMAIDFSENIYFNHPIRVKGTLFWHYSVK